MSLIHLLEPEETVGNAWHRLVGGKASLPAFPDAAVRLEEVTHQLRVFFRGLGGGSGVDIVPAAPEVSHHRLTRTVRIGRRSEKIARARFDGCSLGLPSAIESFPDRRDNKQLYFWLAAWTAAAGQPPSWPADPLQRDLARIAHAQTTTQVVLARFPGLVEPYRRLAAATLAARPQRALPPAEDRVETLVREALTASPLSAAPAELPALEPAPCRVDMAPSGYQTFLPVQLWPTVDLSMPSGPGTDDHGATTSRPPAQGDGTRRRARRRASDQIRRKGGFFVHRFEKILTWTEFMNLHRDVEDDDDESARKAADDHDELGLGTPDKRPASRLKLDLDLAPADVEAERLSDAHTYPEWDWRRAAYLPDHVRVLERLGDGPRPEDTWEPGPKARLRIRSVRRQFEALRPRREIIGRQLDGHELDMDEVIRSRADILACGQGSDRLFRASRELARDLSIAVLVDVSRSTESYVESRPIIDIEREALVALAEGLEACGDEAAIFAFSSLRRDRVMVARVKEWDEKAGATVRGRIAALRPGFYTRLGAAIRHTSAALARRPSRKRLLVVLTDGKPNDLDHYEGRHGIEDTRRAIREARRSGQSVFGITIDRRAEGYFSHMFGAGGFSILSRPSRLTMALPMLYRHLVG